MAQGWNVLSKTEHIATGKNTTMEHYLKVVRVRVRVRVRIRVRVRVKVRVGPQAGLGLDLRQANLKVS